MSALPTNKDEIRKDYAALIDALIAAGFDCRAPKRLRCIWHEDEHPSAGVYEREGGVWAYHCHGCNLDMDVFDVRARASGRPVSDELKAARAPAAPPLRLTPAKQAFPTLEALSSSLRNVSRVYTYTHPGTRAAELAVIRCEPPAGKKTFIQASPSGGGWVMEAPAKPWPLYNRARVAKASSVVVVEGEKCVHILAELGVVATTSPGGAKNAKSADWTPLAGKSVILWPDHDPNGQGYMDDVARQLELIEPAPSLSRVDVAALGLPAHGDVEQYLELNGGSRDDRRVAVELVMHAAEPLGASREVRKRLEDMIAGKWVSIDWPWPKLSKNARALYPGTITVLCGDPGSTKSFLLLEAMWHWHANGHKVALLELEKDKRYHLHRALAQMSGNSSITREEWVMENPDEALALEEGYRTTLDSFGRCVFDAPTKEMSLPDLSSWVEERAAAGCRLIGIDPITAAASSDTPWLDDQRFILEAERAMDRHGSSLILVTHPRSGAKNVGTHMDNMAGGRAYSRFTDTVLWLRRPDHPEAVNVAIGLGCRKKVTIDRGIQIRKSRNGPGAGLELGYVFDAKTLRFAELGVIVEDEE